MGQALSGGMKNQILALFAILAVLGLTATGAQAHTVHGFGHGHGHGHGHFRHHHEFRNGEWCDWDDDDDAGVGLPGFFINLNL